MPPRETALKLLSMMQSPSMKDRGFILSLKRIPSTESYYDEVLSLAPKNLLIKGFVPQKKLLHHPKIKLFVSHCGANSIHEALYFGKPLLGLP
mmetsp:Transcript_16435/g.11601  ORF Transcript_16435/g.11601 Transcript_16435/m.11601 type:complete len:93 (+) Transcript_16435:138-416(+)